MKKTKTKHLQYVGKLFIGILYLIHPKSRPISTCLPRESHANETNARGI